MSGSTRPKELPISLIKLFSHKVSVSDVNLAI